MEKTIRVRLAEREYALRVREEHEAATRQMADYVDKKLVDFRKKHPEQPELTAAVITALSIAEEYFAEREKQESLIQKVDAELHGLGMRLNGLIPVSEPSGNSSGGPNELVPAYEDHAES